MTPSVALEARAQAALDWLERHGSTQFRDDLAPRYGIHTEKAFGVKMADIQKLGKELGRDHELAAALWATGWYEARLLTAFVDEPSKVTAEQMERWCRDFDNWGVCDTLCFKLFDRTPHAWAKIAEWSDDPAEFVRRTAFVLLACVALHDKKATDARFLVSLPLVERAAADDRNFVKKGLVWALRAVAGRNVELKAAVIDLAGRLAETPKGRPERWVGKTVLRELNVGK